MHGNTVTRRVRHLIAATVYHNRVNKVLVKVIDILKHAPLKAAGYRDVVEQ
jgi:hypothetical protein